MLTKAFPLSQQGFSPSETELGLADREGCQPSLPELPQLPMAPVLTTVLLISAVRAVVDAIAVLAGWDAGAIWALEAIALLF